MNVQKIGFSVPRTFGSRPDTAANTGSGCMLNVGVVLRCSLYNPRQAPMPSWYIMILPPLNRPFSSAPSVDSTFGWTRPSLCSLTVNSSASRYSGVSYLCSRPPPLAFLRQPVSVELCTP
jgi:hypothetical protein